MNVDIDEPEVIEENYGSGWIQQSWLWACDDCLHDALDDEDEAAGTEAVSESCGSCDTVHEARLALMQHNATRHHTKRDAA